MGRVSAPEEAYARRADQRIALWTSQLDEPGISKFEYCRLKNKISSLKSRMNYKELFDNKQENKDFAGFQSNFKKLVSLIVEVNNSIFLSMVWRKILIELVDSEAMLKMEYVMRNLPHLSKMYFINALEKYIQIFDVSDLYSPENTEQKNEQTL